MHLRLPVRKRKLPQRHLLPVGNVVDLRLVLDFLWTLLCVHLGLQAQRLSLCRAARANKLPDGVPDAVPYGSSPWQRQVPWRHPCPLIVRPWMGKAPLQR